MPNLPQVMSEDMVVRFDGEKTKVKSVGSSSDGKAEGGSRKDRGGTAASAAPTDT